MLHGYPEFVGEVCGRSGGPASAALCPLPGEVVRLHPNVVGVVFHLPIALMENRCRLRLHRVGIERKHPLPVRRAFAPAAMVGIPPGARESHLEKFSRHGHANEVTLPLVLQESPVERIRRLASQPGRAEPPQRK